MYCCLSGVNRHSSVTIAAGSVDICIQSAELSKYLPVF